MKYEKQQDCPFCDPKIYEEQLVLENQYARVLYNIRPAKNKGRCIVVPKRHVQRIWELREDESLGFMRAIVKTSSKIIELYKPEGVNYGLNEGSFAGQTIFHMHFHILPRYSGDGYPKYHIFHRDPAKKRNLTTEELRPSVEELKSSLAE